MKKTYFLKAKAIWAEGKEDELNSSLFFKTVIYQKGTYKFSLCANNFYRIFINGKLKGYGPSRDAHDYYRVDNYKFDLNETCNVIVIEVSGSNCNSFYALNTKPFFICEIKNEYDGVIKTSDKDFTIFNNETRIRKVTRFAYQRAFSESYNIDDRLNILLNTPLEPYRDYDGVVIKNLKFEDRIVNYPILKFNEYQLIENGISFINENKKIYEDRYQVLDYLKIFPKDEWEIDSNKVASQLDFKLNNEHKKLLKKWSFATFSNKISLTGFIRLKLKVKKDALIYVIFDEIDIKEKGKEDLIGIDFSRNTTHNCITYSLKEGDYNLISFEPYTLKYARIICLEGEVSISKFGVIKYENKDCSIKYNFNNEKINKVFDAAINTFKQNAVDLLTDCPSRERAGWLCDSYFSGQAEPILTGYNLVESAFLDNYSKCEKDNLPKGMIPMCYPADFPSKEFIPNWSLWYILEIYNYINRGGSKSILNSSINNIKGILDYFKDFENELGLLENLKGWIFVEWSKANDIEFIKGINYPTNMLYSEALIKAGILLNDNNLINKGNKLKEIIYKYSFNNEFFIDNSIRDKDNNIIPTDHTTETCQYYALYFNIIKKEDNEDYFNKMINNFGEYRDDKLIYPNVYKSNVLMGILLRLMILNKYGLYNKVFNESIEYFYKMAITNGTLWEHDSIFASLNHCFTSFIVNIILEANFGLTFIDYKNKNIYLNKVGLYDEAKVIIPIKKDKLILETKDNKLNYILPKDYKIIWN